MLKSLPDNISEQNMDVITQFHERFINSKSSIQTAVNKKSGNVYYILELVLNATNSNDGQVMVLYSRSGKYYVRDIHEFITKFDPR